jgi:hypothetical protein
LSMVCGRLILGVRREVGRRRDEALRESHGLQVCGGDQV